MYSFTVFFSTTEKWNYISPTILQTTEKQGAIWIVNPPFLIVGPRPKGPELEKNVRLAAALRLAGSKKKLWLLNVFGKKGLSFWGTGTH